MTTVTSINPQMLQWARQRAGIGTSALRKKFPKLPAWEDGVVFPTLRQLEDFSRATWAPLGYFFLAAPPDEKLEIPDFRKTALKGGRRPSPNLLDTLQEMQRRQGWLSDYLAEDGAAPLTFIGSATLNDDPKRVAQAIRKSLSLDSAWANGCRTWTDATTLLMEKTNEAGIVAICNGVVGNNTHRKLDVEEFRGFVLSDPYAPFVFINGADAKGAQMFTLAHELAHLWLGGGGVINFRMMLPEDFKEERFCDRVAAEFLVPSAEFQAAWNEAQSHEEPFQYLARDFKVSQLVIARRALDFRYMSREDFFDFYEHHLETVAEHAAQQKSGGNFYATANHRIGLAFGAHVVRAARSGRLLYRDAYRLTGLTGCTFDRYAEKLSIRLGVPL